MRSNVPVFFACTPETGDYNDIRWRKDLNPRSSWHCYNCCL